MRPSSFPRVPGPGRPSRRRRPSRRVGLLVALLVVLGASSRPLHLGATAWAQAEPEPSETAPVPTTAPAEEELPTAPAEAGRAEGGCACHSAEVVPEPMPPPPAPVAVEEVAVVTDRDGDGIPDRDDRCPDAPEDKDGFQDDDGCPDPDNDGDGIVDAADHCPNDPGTAEGTGCPTSAPTQTIAKATPVETRPGAGSGKAQPVERARPTAPSQTRPATRDDRLAVAERTATRTMASGEQLRWVIAVMDVQAPNDPTMKKTILRGLSDQTRVLLAVRKLKVVDRGQQEAALKQVLNEEKEKSYAACVDASCQIPLGKVLAASHILRLTISRFGDTCTTNGELIDLTSEVSSGAATTRSACKDTDLLDAVERVADELIASAKG